MKQDIIEIINRETRAWDNVDVDLLLSIFHPDMVWIWPKNQYAHNPAEWETPQGKFDLNRWTTIYKNIFSNFTLIHNNRDIIKVVETNEKDGGFAVVDIDTLWINKQTDEKNALDW